MKGANTIQYGYPQYSLVSGSPRSSRSERFRPGVCPSLRIFSSALALGFLLGAGFMLWPSQPDVDVTHTKLIGINIDFEDRKSLFPAVSLDINLELVFRIRNHNFFGVVYDKIRASISYRETKIGNLAANGGTVRARSEVRAKATLDLKGKELFQHISEFLVDAANREIPLDTVTVFSGAVQILFFRKHVEVTVACQMLVDPRDKEVLSQECSLVF